MSESIITALFACPLDSTSSSVNGPPSSASRPPPRLAEFIAYALHRTRLPDVITFQALFLLRRLKSRFPAARGSSGHRLFISALMLASKSSCDDTYSNKSWTIVSQGLFTLREVNQMERELFGYLGFKVNVELEELTIFRALLLAGDINAVIDCCGSDVLSSAPSTPANASPLPVMEQDVDTPKCPQRLTKSSTMDSPAPLYSVESGLPTYSQCNGTNLSPSESNSSSGRGSISSASGVNMTPSPLSESPSEASNSSSNTPDTPPSELCGSPWNEGDVKTASPFSGEPAGTYDNHLEYYQQLKSQRSYGQQQPIYTSSVANSNQSTLRNPFR